MDLFHLERSRLVPGSDVLFASQNAQIQIYRQIETARRILHIQRLQKGGMVTPKLRARKKTWGYDSYAGALFGLIDSPLLWAVRQLYFTLPLTHIAI